MPECSLDRTPGVQMSPHQPPPGSVSGQLSVDQTRRTHLSRPRSDDRVLDTLWRRAAGGSRPVHPWSPDRGGRDVQPPRMRVCGEPDPPMLDVESQQHLCHGQTHQLGVAESGASTTAPASRDHVIRRSPHTVRSGGRPGRSSQSIMDALLSCPGGPTRHVQGIDHLGWYNIAYGETADRATSCGHRSPRAPAESLQPQLRRMVWHQRHAVGSLGACQGGYGRCSSSS